MSALPLHLPFAVGLTPGRGLERKDYPRRARRQGVTALVDAYAEEGPPCAV